MASRRRPSRAVNTAETRFPVKFTGYGDSVKILHDLIKRLHGEPHKVLEVVTETDVKTTYRFEMLNGEIVDDAAAIFFAKQFGFYAKEENSLTKLFNPFLSFASRPLAWEAFFSEANPESMKRAFQYLISSLPNKVDSNGKTVFMHKTLGIELPDLSNCRNMDLNYALAEFIVHNPNTDPYTFAQTTAKLPLMFLGVAYRADKIIFLAQIRKFLEEFYNPELVLPDYVSELNFDAFAKFEKATGLDMKAAFIKLNDVVGKDMHSSIEAHRIMFRFSSAAMVLSLSRLFNEKYLTPINSRVDELFEIHELSPTGMKGARGLLADFVEELFDKKMSEIEALPSDEQRVEYLKLKKISDCLNIKFESYMPRGFIPDERTRKLGLDLREVILADTLEFALETVLINTIKQAVENTRDAFNKDLRPDAEKFESFKLLVSERILANSKSIRNNHTFVRGNIDVELKSLCLVAKALNEEFADLYTENLVPEDVFQSIGFHMDGTELTHSESRARFRNSLLDL